MTYPDHPYTEEDWAPPPDEVYELIVCPTCDFHHEPNEDVEEGHKQPCPECGFTLTLVRATVDEDGASEVSIRWDPGEGAPLFVDDASTALKLAADVWAKEVAEEERIDDAITDLRRERRAQADREAN